MGCGIVAAVVAAVVAAAAAVAADEEEVGGGFVYVVWNSCKNVHHLLTRSRGTCVTVHFLVVLGGVFGRIEIVRQSVGAADEERGKDMGSNFCLWCDWQDFLNSYHSSGIARKKFFIRHHVHGVAE